ncbi:unnamed protein product [Rotaria socialis]|uniref:FLYWCH-type domain-containing protein n=2 Tax=Rotaria socialis TaxID=392032 RepID=A0A818GRE6_9BILA|nr:unnamed protein product [Rotaria socialis]
MPVHEEPRLSIWHHQGSSWSREQLLAGKQKIISHSNQFVSSRFLQQQIPFNNSVKSKRTQIYFTKVVMSVTLTKTSKNTPLLIHNSYSYTIDRKTVTKILWKCEYSRKYSCHGRLHTTSNYELIKIVGEHENHVGNSRCAATRKYFEKLKQESEQNHTTPHNILTQVNIGVPDEVRVQLPTNYNLKRNVRRWRQVTTTAPTPTTIDFPAIPTKYHQTTRNTIFFRKDTGSGLNRMLLFFTDE